MTDFIFLLKGETFRFFKFIDSAQDSQNSWRLSSIDCSPSSDLERSMRSSAYVIQLMFKPFGRPKRDELPSARLGTRSLR